MRDSKSTFEYTASTGDFAGKTLKGGFAKIIEAIERLVKINGIQCLHPGQETR
jgi:hypothetical protein